MWNFVGFFLGAFGANAILAVLLLVFGLLENWGFTIPSGKNNGPEYGTDITEIISILLIIGNLLFIVHMSMQTRASKCLGYIAGALLPLILVGRWLITGKVL